jgi:predicted Ser/Thr protein kinase
MGELFLGWDSQLDRKLAIKLVHARSSSAAAEERLRQEAKALAQLSHPNVVQVFEVGSHAGRVYVAMEFVEGKSLRDWLAALQLDGARRVAAIVEHFVAAGRGLEAVHGTGLIHRDFKPSNVVVGDDGRVRIIDFGLASELDDGPEEDETPPQTNAAALTEKERARWDATLTDTGVLLGTPRYMAPEQWRGRAGDMRSDQFAWCVALFEALYGVHPFEHTGVEGLAKRASSTLRKLGEKAGLADAMAHSEIELPPRWAEAPARVREALVRGLSLDPKARFSSMTELLDHIAPPAASGRRTLAAVIGGCLLAIGATIVVSLLLLPDRDGASTTSAIAHARIEALAARDLVRVQQRVAELDAQGQLAEADETFAAFAELPEYAQTSALGRGWLDHAKRLAARGDTEGELDAYGAAYISASPETQREALFGLARVFARTRQWPALRATLDTLGALAAPVDQARDAERCGMRVVEMVARHELAGAARAVDNTTKPDCAIHPAITAAIVELARVTPTEHDLDVYQLRVAPTPGLDLDDDGVGELLVHRPGEARLTVLGSASPSLTSVASIDLREVPSGLVILPHPEEPMVSLRTGTRLSLHRIGLVDGAPTLTPLFEFDQQHEWPTRWVSGDLDRDGRLEAYASVTPRRRLLVASPGASGWVAADPHPPTTASNSVPYELVIDDFDGDARLELAVAVGEWNAYDLRIFGSAPRQGDDTTGAAPMLELLGRRKLGTAQSIATLPAASGSGKWIVVGVSALYPSQRVFQNPPANGIPGVYVFAWDGEALEQIAYVDVTPPDLMFTGDFNGDALADLALASHLSGVFQTTLLIQTAPGSFEPLSIDRLWPIGVFDRDRDGDDELLVVDTSGQTGPRLTHPRGRLYVLGSGDGRLPGIVDAETAPNLPLAPPTEDDALRASIARAEVLATIGLPLRAAAELRKLARVAEPELAANLWVRAAELLEARGHRLAAADLYAQACADPQLLGERAAATRRKAIQLYEQVHRFRAAADMAAAALELDPSLQAEHARLQALASDEPQLVFDFDEPLDAGWTIDPLAVRRRGGRLEFDLGGAEQDVVARRELEYRGGRFAIDVELDIELIEWGSEINVALRPVGGEHLPALPVGAATRGGGGLYKLEFACVGLQVAEPGVVGYPISQPRAELPEDHRRYRLRTELVPSQSDDDSGNVWCSAEGNGVHIESAVPNAGLFPGRYELVIFGSRVDRWSRAAGSIDRIVISGVHDVDPPPPSPAEQLARELAEGRMEAVLEGLDAATTLPTRERALLEFLALDELGRPDEREAALISALGPCGEDEASRTLVGTLLRHRPEHLAADLRRLCGMDRYYSIFMQVWATAIYQHPDATAVGRVLTTQTTELERWQPRDVADRHAVLALLCARARARLSLGTPGPNRADLQRAVELGDKWLAEGEAPGRTELASQLGRCRVDLAAELLDRGEANGAIETLRETLGRSPTPEILADMLTIDPRFASLRERPDWRELIEPARAGVDLNAAHR